jgi:hypothetical protein
MDDPVCLIDQKQDPLNPLFAAPVSFSLAEGDIRLSRRDFVCSVARVFGRGSDPGRI